jgi:hypothetical protein
MLRAIAISSDEDPERLARRLDGGPVWLVETPRVRLSVGSADSVPEAAPVPRKALACPFANTLHLMKDLFV